MKGRTSKISSLTQRLFLPEETHGNKCWRPFSIWKYSRQIAHFFYVIILGTLMSFALQNPHKLYILTWQARGSFYRKNFEIFSYCLSPGVFMNNKKFKKLCLGQSKVVKTTKSRSEEKPVLLTSKSNYLSIVNNLVHAFDILKLITPLNIISPRSL